MEDLETITIRRRPRLSLLFLVIGGVCSGYYFWPPITGPEPLLPPRLQGAAEPPTSPTACAALGKRVALVVGNSAYASADHLPNAINDAEDITKMLRNKLCFDVTLEKDVTHDGFAPRVDAFVAKARGAELALFYFAGHGLQHDGKNYLLPIDPSLSGPLALENSAVTAQKIVAALNGKARYTLVLLDACRNNPFQERLARAVAPAPLRGPARIERGLAPMQTPSDSEMLILFATRSDKSALDSVRGGRNSPLAQAMLEKFASSDTDLQLALSDVRQRVDELTQGGQIPEISGDLRHRLTLLPVR